tara:strand:- start:225 stop:776 length:552 start_codon:yes stop_codon:yes gene_type:complete
MIRFFDVIISIIVLILTSPILLMLLIYYLLIERSNFLFMQVRVGQDKKPFKILKIRTMKKGTKNLLTHNLDQKNITRIGFILRKYKIDEIPQFVNVILGQMSIVGPRPGLTTDKELIDLRSSLNLFKHKPGITGLSQILNIDMSDPEKLANSDLKMYEDFNLIIYLKYIFLTLFRKKPGDKQR